MSKCKITIFVIVFLIANASSAFACVCAETTFDETVLQSKAVFSGKVVKAEYKKGIVTKLKEEGPQPAGKKVEYEVLVVTFEVERWWKGGATAEVSLITEQTKYANGFIGVSSCDYEYTVGEKYLVFAHADKDRLISGVCTPTNKLERANKELELLGEGKEPEKLRNPSVQ